MHSYSTKLMNQILKSPKAQKIVSQVSAVYGESYVGLWLFQDIGTQLDNIDEWAREYTAQVVLQTATWALPYYEQTYNIPTNTSLTEEQRRSILLSTILTRAPMNPTKVKHIIESIIDDADARVDIVENTGKNRFVVKIEVAQKSTDIKHISRKLDEVKPAHILYSIDATYNKHILISNINELKLAVLNLHLYNQYYAADIQLDGKRYLDGSWRLNGDTPHKADLDSLEIQAQMPNRCKTVQSISIAVFKSPELYNQNVSINVGASVKNTNKINYQVISIFGSIANPSNLTGSVTTDTMWYLDDEFMLDDSRSLNADIITEQI